MHNMALPPYQYQGLSPNCQTRILELQPSTDLSAPLHCNLREIDVATDPFYDALSYTWGGEVLSCDLIINNSLLKITSNLHDALLRFRLCAGARKMWVDAVCINQNDDDDKARQIPFMAEIYRSASSVVVWLGIDAKAAACMTRLDILTRLKSAPDDSGTVVEDAEYMLQLPWFSRRWIIQEVVLNPNVTLYCGRSEIQWIRLLQLMRVHLTKGYADRVDETFPYRTMEALWKTFVMGIDAKNTTGILRLLETFEKSECFDKRDVINAIAGLASDVYLGERGPGVKIHVDYSKTVEQVYADFAFALLQDKPGRANLFIGMTESRSDGSHLGGISSIAPDWRLPRRRSSLWHVIDTMDFVWFWDEVDDGCFEKTANMETLRFRPKKPFYYHGVVSAVFEPFRSRKTRATVEWIGKAWNFIIDWIKNSNAEQLPTSNETSMLAIQLFQTLCGPNSGFWTLEKAAVKMMRKALQHNGSFDTDVLSSLLHCDITSASEANPSTQTLFEQIWMVMEGRTLFIMPVAPELAKSSKKFYKEMFSRKSLMDRPKSKWPVLGVGPSHMLKGDGVFSADTGMFSMDDYYAEVSETYGFVLRGQESINKGFFIGESFVNRFLGIQVSIPRPSPTDEDFMAGTYKEDPAHKEARKELDRERKLLPQVTYIDIV